MRIVAGVYGGRRLEAPKGRDIRPTSDKVRGAMFNALRSRGAVEGAQVLDAFCGSGALGLEALSQGAAECTFVDKARESLDLCQRNAETLGADWSARFLLKDTAKIGARSSDIMPADLVFLDPPYAKGLVGAGLKALDAGGWLVDGAWVVCEVEKGFSGALPEAYVVENEKAYGETRVIFTRYQARTPL
ncbi:MAG: 16S rRNA (guanine(966)-N(2))-methyltransferase RsmD [Alphaproteobacteria bacterium]|nr:16S rRNA (guanine(966)-N(2))-methyltransferase RsmD [Alphaproteobacteria bacterium]